jgi:N-acetyl-alpha-D-muramate 1-phosphate uridylyltransferase
MAVKRALIFAAGLGKRMRPLTETTPKPLLEVAGKSLIQYHIEKLVSCGICELVINTHWLANRLVEELGDGHQFGVRIHWSYEPNILDTGGGMRNALPLLGSENDEAFLVVNSDVWTDYPICQLKDIELAAETAHLVMVPNPDQHPEGDFGLDSQGRLDNATLPGRTYAGIGLFTVGFIRRFGSDRPSFPLREALQAAIAYGKVTAELYQGAWEDVGTPERLDELNARVNN